MALDEATAGLMAQLAQSGMKPVHEMTPEESRGLGGALLAMYGPGPQMSRVEDHKVPTPDGGHFGVRLLVPDNGGKPSRAVIVYYHGGGWVVGSIDESDTFGRQLAQRTGAVVVLVEYRLAPEHRYPTAAEDAWTALRWVDERVEEIAGSRVPLVVAGDSAGGNLAAVVAQRAQRAGGPKISLQVLAYPVTDADLDTASYLDPANQLLVSRDAMIWFWNHYAPDPETRGNLDASPLRATDLAGQPPTVMLTAEYDVLRDASEAYADKLRAAGVAVSQRRFPGQAHGFLTMVNVLPGAADGLDFVVEQFDQHLNA